KMTETNPRQLIDGSSRNIKWTAGLGSMTYGDPVVADGLIWVGTNNHWSAQDKLDASVLACFRESDGKLLYRYVSPRLPGRAHDWEHSSIRCSPYIENDRLWFVTNRAEVVCLDIAPLRKDGGEPTVLWKVNLIGKFGVFPRGPIMFWAHSCSIAGYCDWIYVVTGNGVDETYNQVARPDAPSLICFNKNTGAAVWQNNSPGPNILLAQWASPTIIEIDGRVQCVAPLGDGWVRSFDALTGKLIWEFDMNPKESKWSLQRSTREDVLASPVFADNRIFIATGRHPEWGEGRGRLVCLDPTRQGDISSELAVDAAGNGIPPRRVQAVDAAQGEKAIPNPNSGLVWEFKQVGDGKQFTDAMHGVMSNAAVQKGLVISADQDGLVHCLDAKTGERYWAYDSMASIYGSPLIVDDKVYVADSDGDVMVFGLSADPDVALRKLNGEIRPLREQNMVSAIYCSPIYANGVLYLTTHNRLSAIAADPNEPDFDLAAGYWPQWRGPNRDNVSSEKGLLQEWPAEGPPRLWTATGVGEGIASVSVAEGKIFTFGYQAESEFVVALDEKTGELSWATRAGPIVAESSLMRWLSQRTPTVDGSRLYLATNSGDLVCLSTAGGRELWRKSYTADFGARRPMWGFCDYPLVDGDSLICTPGGPDAKIAALDKETGNVIWKTQIPGAQNEQAAYSALVVSEVGGLRQYVTFLAGGLVGVAADDGRLLWRYDELGKLSTANSHTSIVRGDQIFCSNGYGGGVALLKAVRNGKNVTVNQIYKHGGSLDAFQDATTLVGDHLYVSQRDGFPACLSWQTGEKVWGPQRLEGRGKMAIAFADGCLYYRHSDGRMTLAEATPEKYVQRGMFVIPGHTPAVGSTSPVIARRRLYLRDNNLLHCYDIRADALQDPLALPREVSLDVPAAATRARGAAANPARESQPLRGVFVPTPHDLVKQMLDLAQLKKTDVVFDLGSGDGRIVIAAAKDFGCKAV
ncbi:MAG TPA: PQQ-binding-like beta-propeller repeat protein, partial [Planctomycetaceae bacterium]